MLELRITKNLDLIRRLDEKIFEDDKEDVIGRVGYTWWLAIYDGKIAGFCGLHVFDEDVALVGYLCKAGVLKQYRGKGIQRAMILVRDREARRLKCDDVITYTANWNYASINNLMGCGYKMYDPETRYGLKSGVYFRKKP